MNLILHAARSSGLRRVLLEAKTIETGFSKHSFSSAGFKKYQWLRDSWHRQWLLWTLGIAAIPAGYLTWKQICSSVTVHAIKTKRKDGEVKTIKLTSRERRFLRFASVEYDGQLYMTPQDFLESVVEAEPRPRLKRRTLSKHDLDSIREHTPALDKGSAQMFRNLRDKGIISYTEYLFLLSTLTNVKTYWPSDPRLLYLIPLHTYKQEFSIQKMQVFVRHSILESYDRRSARVSTPLPSTSHNPKLEEIFSLAWKEKRGIVGHDDSKQAKATTKDIGGKAPGENLRMEEILNEVLVDDDRGLQRRHFVDTTLLVHFFGPKGQRDIRYEDFKKFMEDLQTEVQELEFHEFSKGLDSISQIDFAKILLRYTYLDTEEYELYLERLTDRIKLEQGITFLEFRAFCQFLNNLDDFSVAMRMYTLADRPISQEEFRRAVRICTGTDLSPHVIETVFQIFDADNDSHLSHREFIGVMKDRLHRGFKVSSKAEGFEAFKACLKQELRAT